MKMTLSTDHEDQSARYSALIFVCIHFLKCNSINYFKRNLVGLAVRFDLENFKRCSLSKGSKIRAVRCFLFSKLSFDYRLPPFFTSYFHHIPQNIVISLHRKYHWPFSWLAVFICFLHITSFPSTNCFRYAAGWSLSVSDKNYCFEILFPLAEARHLYFDLLRWRP